MSKQKLKFYIGVEGGATRSEAILTDENLKILMRRKGKALNYHDLGSAVAKENLASLIVPLIKKISEGKLYATFGLAGLDTPKEEILYKRLVGSVLPNGAAFEVVNDTKIALEARCGGEKSGILVIAGTGSNVYGESNRRTASSVGWDFIFGDEGGGYYFGGKALRAATRAWDGRGQKTVLENLILKKARVKSMDDLIPKVYGDLYEKKQTMKYYIAAFAPVIDEAIRRGDRAAMEIRDEGARELVLGVRAVAARIRCLEKSFCLGTMGSMWKMPGFEEVFKKQIQKICPKVRFSENKDSGAWGAVLLAKKIII